MTLDERILECRAWINALALEGIKYTAVVFVFVAACIGLGYPLWLAYRSEVAACPTIAPAGPSTTTRWQDVPDPRPPMRSTHP